MPEPMLEVGEWNAQFVRASCVEVVLFLCHSNNEVGVVAIVAVKTSELVAQLMSSTCLALA